MGELADRGNDADLDYGTARDPALEEASRTAGAGRVSNPFNIFESQIKEEKNEIKELKSLLTRAADALDQWCEYGTYNKKVELIAELRKAAE
jgi:hypothetical protein